jgi:parallel beta-helix repeat protein
MFKTRAISIAALLVAVFASGATYTVTTTNDGGPGSLRQAISDANFNAGLDTIVFNIGSGPKTIRPSSNMPSIISPVIIDATTQPGYGGAPIIELDGSLTSNSAGFWITAGGSTVRGMVINHWVNGIVLDGNGGNTIEGCYIGTDMSGQGAAANTNGIWIAYGSSNNTIGTAGYRNVISGNNYGIELRSWDSNHIVGTIIRNNWIGLSASGNSTVPNYYGIDAAQADGTIVGGTGSNQGNVFSGNVLGMAMGQTTGTMVQGNLFGTNANGSPGLGGNGGVHFGYGSNNTIAGNTFTSHNSTAISLQDVSDIVIQGNTITDNGSSIWITQTSTESRNITVSGNTIRGSGSNPLGGAVNIYGVKNVSVLGNSISGSYGLAIDFNGDGVTANDNGDGDDGANHLQNFPVLTTVSAGAGQVLITGTLNSVPNQTYRIEFYANGSCDSSGYGEGETYLGFQNVSTNGSGNASFTANFPATIAANAAVTATATDSNGNTSEFSACVTAKPNPGVLTFNGDVSMPESITPASLQIVRLGGSAGTVSVDWATHDGTAKSPGDYTAASGTLTFADGETSKNITIPVINDSTFEATESFTVTLSNPTGGATLGSQTTATVTINDDDHPPSLTVDDAHMNEGNSGTANMAFSVKLSPPSPATATVAYSTAGVTATQGDDFDATTGTLSFAPGETEKTIAVPIHGDGRYELDETFTVTLQSPVNADLLKSQAIGTIVNDDPRPIITVSDPHVSEGTGGASSATVTLTSDQPLNGEIDYSTADGTAKAVIDYQAIPFGFVQFSNETTKSITIPLVADTEPEPNETFTLKFGFNSTFGTLDHNPAEITIVNDDSGFGPRAQNIPLGTSAQFNLELGNTPAAPVTATLTSSNDKVLDLPATLSISQASTAFSAPSRATGSTLVSLTLPAPYSKTFTADVTVYEPAKLVLKPESMRIPQGSTLAVTASFAPPATTSSIVQLRAGDPTIIDVPASITIEPGKSTTFNIKGLKQGSTVLLTTLGADHGSEQGTFFVDVIAPSKTPMIAQIDPNNGPASGGTNVTLTGANLSADCRLHFGGIPASNVVLVSPTTMTATTPAHPPGVVDVMLTCVGDVFKLEDGFTFNPSAPVVSSVTPTSGSSAGGTLVRVTGSNFRSGCWPTFDHAPARSATFVSAAEIIGETPPHGTGPVDVGVRCSAGSDGSLANAFTYSRDDEPTPQISAVNPQKGTPGESITITGVRFRHDDAVTFDDTAATVLSSTPDTKVVRVPDMKPGDVAITITDNGGHKTTTGPVFTVLDPTLPHIEHATPGVTRPGTDLVVDGSGFRPGFTFAFGANRTATVMLEYTNVVLRVPDVPPGQYPLNVLNAAGEVKVVGPSVAVAATGTSISSISPACGSTEGGGTMVINGSGFETGAVVSFNDVLAVTKVIDGKTLNVTIPPGAVGAARIVIANPSGDSATLSGAFVYFSPLDPNGGCSGGRSRPSRH